VPAGTYAFKKQPHLLANGVYPMKIAGNIRELLTHKPTVLWSVGPEMMVYDAIQLMADKNVGALLIMSGGSLLGIVSERDYTRKVVLKGKSSKQTAVRDIVSTPVVTATPQDTVEECMRLMTENRIRHLPVVDAGKVIGIISIGDLVNWTISAQNIALNQMEGFISGRYPG